MNDKQNDKKSDAKGPVGKYGTISECQFSSSNVVTYCCIAN